MPRGRGLPIVARIGLTIAVLVLGAGVLVVGAGGLARVVSGLGGTLTGFVSGVTTTPSPTPSTPPIADAPMIAQPEEPYTSSDIVDLVVTVPSAVVGRSEYEVQVYLALPDQDPAPIDRRPIGDTQKLVIPMTLAKGTNDFSVSIVGPGGESELSPMVRFILDNAKPKITITSPKDGVTINGKKATLKGKVQARSTVVVRNADNDSSVTGTAATDGSFEIAIGLAPGQNRLTVTVTDPAGNENTKELGVKRGEGRLSVSISASQYRISRKSLPTPIRLICEVLDPDGNALSDARVTLTLSIPGIQTITREGTTDRDGRFEFETVINKGAELGEGSAAVLVTSEEFGSTSDLTVIRVTR